MLWATIAQGQSNVMGAPFQLEAPSYCPACLLYCVTSVRIITMCPHPLLSSRASKNTQLTPTKPHRWNILTPFLLLWSWFLQPQPSRSFHVWWCFEEMCVLTLRRLSHAAAAAVSSVCAPDSPLELELFTHHSQGCMRAEQRRMLCFDAALSKRFSSQLQHMCDIWEALFGAKGAMWWRLL